MHYHTYKSLLNILGRAVEQLAGCLAKQQKSAVEVKVQQPGECQLSYEYLMYDVKAGFTRGAAVTRSRL